MVQAMIPGNGESQFSFAGLCQDGQPIASLVARRGRQYPLDFGRASTYVETVDQSEVERLARRLLAAMAFMGLVEVEFKRDPQDGRFKLLDGMPVFGAGTRSATGRVWISPILTWRLIHGDPIAVRHARTGVRWVRLVTDIPTAILAIRSCGLSPASTCDPSVGRWSSRSSPPTIPSQR
jgi:predicted ATP-grasp superfamily ATP-dependent carboligase